MLKRTSFVDSLKVDSLQYSSIIQLGDSCYIQGGNLALAVQREEEIFLGQEGDVRSYRVFSEPILLPSITEQLSLSTNNQASIGIKVGSIDILGVSSSSIVHVGNSKIIQMEARIKHIRHLLHEGDSPFGQETEVSPGEEN
ncbi:spore germination protein GerPE [Bacillus marasmi]|uniref:spore germination protein GerPE n=1 Tax=Bacillus marasmi TaxID=1926279 RepID=UPI0011C73731|nr:spore germination protein GerPE [Bacillus marasmi]